MFINKLKVSYLLYGPHKLNRTIHNKVEGEHNKKATALTGIYITLKYGLSFNKQQTWL